MTAAELNQANDMLDETLEKTEQTTDLLIRDLIDLDNRVQASPDAVSEGAAVIQDALQLANRLRNLIRSLKA